MEWSHRLGAVVVWGYRGVVMPGVVVHHAELSDLRSFVVHLVSALDAGRFCYGAVVGGSTRLSVDANLVPVGPLEVAGPVTGQVRGTPVDGKSTAEVSALSP